MDLSNSQWTDLVAKKIQSVVVDKSFLTLSPLASLTEPNELFAGAIDHTLLKPDATPQQIDDLCSQAIKHKFKASMMILIAIPLTLTYVFISPVVSTAPT
jgi:deoxyribose-phosphate aldolase